MTDPFQRMQAAISDAREEWRECPNYYLFEGYDVAERSPEIYELAIKDGIDLYAPYLITNIGHAPHPFQNGYLLSTKFFRGMMAANQDGKSLAVFMEIQMRASGKLPYAYRYPLGYDTGIARLITHANIRRFGRRSKKDGKIIDRDVNAKMDGLWDCGNVIGCGVFPQSKIVTPGSSMRLGSHQKIVLENWWPAFTGKRKDGLGAFLLPEIIDQQRGSNSYRGANRADYQIFLSRDVTLQLLTYESGAEKFEGIKVPTYLDEEPPDEKIIGAVVTHATDWSLTETPIFGITYTKPLMFPDARTPDMQTFHATAFDCPFHTEDDLRKQRNLLQSSPWEIGARLWGVPTEQQGKPYYDRAKINLWIQRFKVPYKIVTFIPARDWDGIRTNESVSRYPGLLDVPVVCAPAQAEDDRAVWRLYEDRKDGLAYVSASDQANGAETREEVGDWSVAIIGRQFDPENDPTRPQVCAVLRSSLPTPQFAREVLYALRYFNNALLAPESARAGAGAANATFENVCNDWPWWFLDTVEKWSTRKPKETRGFQPTSNRRELLYDKLLRDHFDRFDAETYPQIPDERILREAAAAILSVRVTPSGIASRCDHPSNGYLDMLTAYAIMHYVMQAPYTRQIRCHGGPIPTHKRKTWLELAEERANQTPAQPALGETMVDMRR